MPIIHCTEKLRKEMGLKDADLAPVDLFSETLLSWHAHLIYINRKKCVLFVNDKTRLNFIVPDVSKANIKELGNLFIGMLHPVLAQEEFTEQQRNFIAGNGKPIVFAKTSSKALLGNIKHLTYHYTGSILDAGSLHSHEIPSIISRLNHFPIGSIQWLYPVEAMREEVENI
jgi:hypothetical protein